MNTYDLKSSIVVKFTQVFLYTRKYINMNLIKYHLFHCLHLLRRHVLFVFLILISNVTAKLAFLPDPFAYRINFESILRPVVDEHINYFNGDPLWVLDLSNDDWIFPKLRLGNTAEMEDFYNNITPSIVAARRRQLASANKNPTQTPKPSNNAEPDSTNDTKKNFLKLLNKFILSTNVEPDSYLTDNTYHSDPTVALYFKGPDTGLKVKAGSKQWHYYLEKGPKLADWFYEDHDTRDSPILIPEHVKSNLFSTLLKYLKLMFRYHLNHS